MIDETAAQAIVDFAARKTISPDSQGQDVGQPASPAAKAENDNSSAPSRSGAEQVATEAGHWYLPDGTPFYTTARRNGPNAGQLRPVSLRHDRALMLKLGVVPSSTGITRQLDAPGLNAYREKHIYLATLDLLSSETENLSELSEADAFKRVRDKASEHREKAAARGTSLHTAIERYFFGGEAPGETWKSHLYKLQDTLAQYGIDLSYGESERSFAHPLGYGGKCDWHGIYQVAIPIVIDFKSKDEIELDERGKLVKQLVGDEHVMQLASYREGLRIPNARCINVFVGQNDERIWIHEWNASDLRRGWQLFQLLLRIWKIKNNYYPKKHG